MTAASFSRRSHRRLASAFDEAEIDLDECLRRIQMETSVLSTGAGDRMVNEHEYLQKAVKILETVPCEEQGGNEIVATAK